MTENAESKYFNTSSRITRSKVPTCAGTEATGDVTKKNKNRHNPTASNIKRKLKVEKIDIQYENIKTETLGDIYFKKEKWEPTCWREQLNNMYEMRKNRDAPVDSMGCDVISDVSAKPEVYINTL